MMKKAPDVSTCDIIPVFGVDGSLHELNYVIRAVHDEPFNCTYMVNRWVKGSREWRRAEWVAGWDAELHLWDVEEYVGPRP
jgi:hypothetical protein